MDFDEETLKKLLETFRAELDEQLQVITDALLNLEKGEQSLESQEKTIETIFRSSHTIKGAARGVGVPHIGDIAHHIETLFASIQKKSLTVTSSIIDLCLEAVDCMRTAMLSFSEKKPLNFNIDDLLNRLNYDGALPVTTAHTVTETTTMVDHKEHETIRVSIENLERASALIEEIQASKIAIDDHYSDLLSLTTQTKQLLHSWKSLDEVVQIHQNDENLQKLYRQNTDKIIEINNSTQQLQKKMRARINELTLLSDSLQEEVRMLRLVPASVLLRTLPRTVRDIAHELNKQVEFIITGDGVKMDKMILEGLASPLMHLLRNAIDHGIENAATRVAHGKPEQGRIQIDVREEGDHILLSISDDGEGIDTKKIAALAEQKKIITSTELHSMKQADILELIFRPGFSTKDIITDVSGRGIGLDVVKTNLAQLKGQVSITTDYGKGTAFLLRVPLTLASERGLMIKSGGQPLVVPISLVERVLLLPLDEIIEIESNQAILINQHPVPLRVLSDILGLPRQEWLKQGRLPIMIMRKGSQAIALMVEEILGEREIIVKPLRPPLINVACVAGGTLAGNGQVIIVLNASDLINAALQIEQKTQVAVTDHKKPPDARPHILVVDDSITTRTLEKNILESKDYQVTVAVNGKEAWDLLQHQSFSLIITDITMPVMDGLALTEQVKKNEKLQHLPVIIVTSLGSETEKKRGIEVGANAYIVKNEFESGTLIEIVEQLV